jgi:site-specific DNA recombinase
MTKKIKVGIYPRVSTQEQAKEGYSIGEQIDRLTKYCEAMGWEVYKSYTDPGYSGADTNRPGLQAMLKDIRRGKIHKVVVYKLDRLSRSQKDTLELIEDEFLAHGVDFVSMSENFDTSTPFGRAIVGILAVFAQLEREQIKERMAMGKEARAKLGKWNGGQNSPLGYDYIDGELIINAFEALQVKEMFELASQNVSSYRITELFNEKGYNTRYGVWESSTVRRSLRSKVYLGYTKYNDTWNKGTHDPIISQELFDEVQTILDERADNYNRGRGHGKINSYLGGYLYCSHCGGKYTKITAKHKKPSGDGHYVYEFFGCNSRTKRNPAAVKDPNCKNKHWKLAELTDLVFNQINQLALDPDYMHELKEDKAPDNRSEIIQDEIKNIDDKLSKLMDLYVIGKMPMNILQDKIQELDDQKTKLETEIDIIKAEDSNKLTKDQIRHIVEDFPEVIKRGDFEEIRTVIGELIERIDIDNEDITIHWNF